ncbi:hypothetical protein LINGRAHAP2_LOCUS25280 [Linum grandiflorum]
MSLLSSPIRAPLSHSPSEINPEDRPPEPGESTLSPMEISSVEVSDAVPLTSSAPMGPVSTTKTFSYASVVLGRENATPLPHQSPSVAGFDDISLTCKDGVRSLQTSAGFREKLCAPLRRALVVRLVGKTVGIQYMFDRLRAMWRPEGKLRMVDLDNDVFLAFFDLPQDYNSALLGGPWMILDHYLVVHSWDPSFRITPDLPPKMVVWVRFPKLPYQYYQRDIFVGLGNLIGRFIRIDTPTLRSARGKFARIAVEINVAEPVATGVLLDGVWQDVEYENLPSFCFECGLLGHEVSCCPRLDSLVVVPDSRVAGAPLPVPPAGEEEPSRSEFGPWLTVQRKVRGIKKASLPPVSNGFDSKEARKGKSISQTGTSTDYAKRAVGNSLSLITNKGKKNKKEGNKEGKSTAIKNKPSKASSSQVSGQVSKLAQTKSAKHAKMDGLINPPDSPSSLTSNDSGLSPLSGSPSQTHVVNLGPSVQDKSKERDEDISHAQIIGSPSIHAVSHPTVIFNSASRFSSPPQPVGDNSIGISTAGDRLSSLPSTIKRTKRKGGVEELSASNSSSLRGIIQTSAKPEARARGGKHPKKILNIVQLTGLTKSGGRIPRQILSSVGAGSDASKVVDLNANSQASFDLNQSESLYALRGSASLEDSVPETDAADILSA